MLRLFYVFLSNMLSSEKVHCAILMSTYFFIRFLLSCLVLEYDPKSRHFHAGFGLCGADETQRQYTSSCLGLLLLASACR